MEYCKQPVKAVPIFINCSKVIAISIILCSCAPLISHGNAPFAAMAAFTDDFNIVWGAPNNVNFLGQGNVMELVLNNASASGFASRKQYMFGSIDMKIKLVPGDSAGTVVAYYFSSETENRDELDFEFLGNVSGQPYILQTNIYANGTGGREQRMYLWFDPTTDFHTYSVLWNPQQVLFLVDGTPIRQFANNEIAGVPFLKSQPMGIYGSIWDGSIWATRGGLIKINWGKSPFIVTFGGYSIDACPPGQSPTCPLPSTWWNQGPYLTMDDEQESILTRVYDNYVLYDYCTDEKRYPNPPIECALNVPQLYNDSPRSQGH